MISKNVDAQKVVTFVNDFWRRMKDERQDKEETWKECWLAYNAKFGKAWANIKKYRSRRYVPMSTMAVEAIVAQRIQAVMPHDQWFNVEGRTPDDVESSKVMAALMRWQHFKAKWRKELTHAVLQASIFGNVFWSTQWNTETTWVPDMEAYAGQLGAFAVTGQENPDAQRPDIPYKQRRGYDGPVFRTWNIFDAVTDRHPDDPDTGVMCLQTVKSLAFLKKMAEPDPMTGYSLYENLDGLTNNGSSMTENSDSIQQEVDAALGFYNLPKDGVKIRSAWGDFEIDGEIYHNHVAVVANDATLIRFEPNPFWHGKRPWNLFTLHPDPIEIYGKGDLEVNLGLQDWINGRMNQTIEAAALVNNPMWEVVRDGIFDADRFTSHPGALIEVAQANNIRPLNVPDKTATGIQEVSFAMSKFNESAGAMQSFGGQGYDPSATEVNAVKGMLDAKSAEMAKRIETTLLIPALEMQIQLNQQMMDEPTWIRVTQTDPNGGVENSFGTGSVLMKVSPEDVQGEYDLFPVGSSWMARNQQSQADLIQISQMIAQSPANGVIKWNKWGKWLIENKGVQDAYRFVKSDQELEYEQQQLMAMQAQQQMGGQGGPGAVPGVQTGSQGGGLQSMAGGSGTPPGGGAGTGPVTDTNGGPQRTS